MISVVSPVFSIVTIICPLATPTSWFPNASCDGDMSITGTAAEPSTTAPDTGNAKPCKKRLLVRKIDKVRVFRSSLLFMIEFLGG